MEIQRKNIDDLRSRVVNMALIGFCSLSLLADCFSFIRSLEYGAWSVFILQSVVILFLILVTLYHDRLSIEAKVYSITLAVLIALASGLYGFGLLGSAKVLIIALPVFLSFIISYRKALFILFLFSLVYISYAILYSTGAMVYTFDLHDYASNIRNWIHDYVTIIISSWGLLYVGYHFGQAIIENYVKIEKQHVELSENEKKYMTLFESSNDAIILLNQQCYIDCNIRTFNLFQCEKDYLIGREPYLFSPEFQPDGQSSQEKGNDLFSKIFQGEEAQVFDWQHIRPNGELFDVSVSLNLMAFGNTKYVLAILRDITEKKKIEKELESHRNNLEQLVLEQTLDLAAKNKELELTLKNLQSAQAYLIQSEKMASLGVLTAGVSHEINNPLNFIIGGYYGLENYFERNSHCDDKETQILLTSIKTGVDRVTDIVKGLNQFSRNDDASTEVCDIASIINNCLTMLQSQFKNRIEVVKIFPIEAMWVFGNVGQLHQSFLNVLINSSQAIDSTGTITLKISKQDKHIVIEISDSGSGISPENLARITDPFFTTKDPGKGTGLGLSIAYTIIQEHKGQIAFQSEIDKGTCVTISLPMNHLEARLS